MEQEKKRNSLKKMIFRIFVLVVIIGGIILIGYLLAKHFGINKISREQLQNLIAKAGVWGPLLFILVSFLQVTFIPIPSTVTIVAGNYLFGFGLSFLYSYIGIVLGSIFAFVLGRKIGRPFVNWVVGDKETVDNYLTKMKGKENVVIFFMFLFPFFPDDAICAIAGILPVSLFTFIIMQLVTRATTIVGNLLFLSGEIIPFSGWGIPVIIGLSIIAIIIFIYCFKNADKLNDFFYRFINKILDIFKKNKKEDNKND